MTPYYIVEAGQVVLKPQGRRIEIDTSHYETYIDAKNYKVSAHKDNGDRPASLPAWIVDVDFGGKYTILCDHFGHLLTVMSLLVNLFPKQGPHR